MIKMIIIRNFISEDDIEQAILQQIIGGLAIM